MNLYGFAGGDPVNFSDPFGLCTPWPECMFQGAANWGAQQGGALGAGVLNAAATANAGSQAFGVNDLGAAIGSRDIGGTALAAASFLPVGKLARGAKLVASERLLGEAIAGVGTRVSIAGAGSKAKLRAAGRLVAEYGGEAGDWAKMVGGTVKAEGVSLQVHWYENIKTGLRTEFKHNLP